MSIKLKDVKFKQTILDAFGHPFKLRCGTLDTLVTKIPSLYTLCRTPTTATFEGLQAMPSREVSYDASESDEFRLDEITKQMALGRLEKEGQVGRQERRRWPAMDVLRQVVQDVRAGQMLL